MRVVIAPNSFAGTLTAFEAADAIAEGWRRRRPDDEVVAVPMADGGDGTLEVVEAAVAGARRHAVEVADARGHAVSADWLELPNNTAVVESAQACGLRRLDPKQRNPRLTTTYGVGQLITAAIETGATQIFVGLGGSATVDGGAGMATALGHRLLREDGNGVKVGGENLRALERIEARAPLQVPITAAVDVDATLLGPTGAVAGFALQKGASPLDIPMLEECLTRLADVAERDLPGGPWRDLPGAGAAGGLAFGLAAFAGAQFRAGADLIATLVGLDEAIAGAAVVITGEGHLDDWSHQGKAPGAVLQRARTAGARVLAIAGAANSASAARFDDVALLGRDGLIAPRERVMAAAAELAGHSV